VFRLLIGFAGLLQTLTTIKYIVLSLIHTLCSLLWHALSLLYVQYALPCNGFQHHPLFSLVNGSGPRWPATLAPPTLTVSSSSQSQSYVTTDGQSVFVSSTHLAPNTRFLLLSDSLRVCWCGAPSLTRGRVCLLQLLLVLASAVILGSESRGTHDRILFSQVRDYNELEGQVPAFISHRNRVVQLDPWALGSLFVSSLLAQTLCNLGTDGIVNTAPNSYSIVARVSVPAFTWVVCVETYLQSCFVVTAVSGPAIPAFSDMSQYSLLSTEEQVRQPAMSPGTARTKAGSPKVW
jgi:hypothetical protein